MLAVKWEMEKNEKHNTIIVLVPRGDHDASLLLGLLGTKQPTKRNTKFRKMISYKYINNKHAAFYNVRSKPM